jgi:hypothetical protein
LRIDKVDTRKGNLLHSFPLHWNGAGSLKFFRISVRNRFFERFPRRPGMLGLWGKAKSTAPVAGFDFTPGELRSFATLPGIMA